MKLFNVIIIAITLLVVTPIASYSQSIRGKVIDSETNLPVEFANVILSKSKNGCMTDIRGEFELKKEKGDRFVLISFIGYETKKVRITKKRYFDVSLNPDSEVLDEVVLVGDRTKENPAHFILKKIRKNHSKYSLKQSKNFSYTKYDRVRFDLFDKDSTLKHLYGFKEFNQMTDRKYTKDGLTYLPLLLFEEVNKVYEKTMPTAKKEILEASKTSGFEGNESVTMYIKELYLDYDVFNDHIILFRKKFYSPLSSTALLNYKYAIVDSTMSDEGNRLYEIEYFPRRKNELTFKGSFWADTVQYVVSKIDLTATKGFNVNLVNHINISQDFKKINDHLISVVKDSLTMNFTPFKEDQTIGALGTKTSIYYNQKLNAVSPVSYIKSTNILDTVSYSKSNEDWDNLRPVLLPTTDNQVYSMHEELGKDEKFIFLNKLGRMFTSGYYNVGVVDFGKYFNTIGQNYIEGLRLQLGARTFFTRNDKWRIGGYLAYGFKDNKLKHAIGFKYLLSNNNRVIFSIGARSDMEQRGVLLSQENSVYSKNYASNLLTIGKNNKLTNTTSYLVGLEAELIKNLRFKTTAKYDELRSLSQFNMSYLDVKTGKVVDELKDFQIIVSMIYTPNKKEIGTGVSRDKVFNWFPTLRVKYVRGLNDVLGSGFNYHKVKFYYRQPFLTGFFGKTISTFEAGKIFGTVPLQLMDIIPGNQTLQVSENMFSLMGYYEFVSDTYTTLHIDHHFNGRIMGKIPLLNKFDLRVTTGARALWGDITNQENRDINRSEVDYLAPNKGYYEYSVGVENIFDLLRIDAVWRPTYLNNPNSHPFGVKLDLKFAF
ncbi:MAG: carboxypeptidase-like regulatory domain-containing protein [Ichthyobacteriaceae bacterium]|nr:carboxypeptidase-like regulatory domain-containing protein [Ichthyobacteriaceae bacterium]